jgi:hypothetical protein
MLMKIVQWAWLFSFAMLLASCNPGPPVEIPKVEEIAEMHVDIEIDGITDWMKDRTVEKQKFLVPKEHWEPILDAFRPYKRGTTWTRGYVPGGIILKLNDGTSFGISVLVFETDVMHPRLGSEFITHVGGSARKLRDALKAAYAASPKEEKPDGG